MEYKRKENEKETGQEEEGDGRREQQIFPPDQLTVVLPIISHVHRMPAFLHNYPRNSSQYLPQLYKRKNPSVHVVLKIDVPACATELSTFQTFRIFEEKMLFFT